MITHTWLHCPGGCGLRLSCESSELIVAISNAAKDSPPTTIIPYDKCTHEGVPCAWFLQKLREVMKK